MNPGFGSEGSLIAAFWAGSDSIFACDFRVNREYVCRRIQASAVELVSVIISELSATQFSVTIPSQQGLFA